MEIDCIRLNLTAPRKDVNQKYDLTSLVLVIFASVISGYDSLDGMVEFTKLKLDWFNKFVSLPKAPSKETLRYLLSALNPNELVLCFEQFIAANDLNLDKTHVAIDGKTMKGTGRQLNPALHIVSAWSSEHGITLGMLESEGKKNEIKTIPKLIDFIGVKDVIISIDAMGCQKTIAEKILKTKNDYFLQIKDNQKLLLNEIKAYFHKLEREQFLQSKYSTFEENDKGHGRLETRNYTQFELSDWVSKKTEWAGLKSAVRVERSRTIAGQTTKKVSWYISSLEVDARLAGQVIRQHWSIENPLHWRLDVIFKDDACQLHSAHAPVNMAIIKRYCMNLLKQDERKKTLKTKVMSACIDDGYRERMLFG